MGVDILFTHHNLVIHKVISMKEHQHDPQLLDYRLSDQDNKVLLFAPLEASFLSYDLLTGNFSLLPPTRVAHAAALRASIQTQMLY